MRPHCYRRPALVYSAQSFLYSEQMRVSTLSNKLMALGPYWLLLLAGWLLGPAARAQAPAWQGAVAVGSSAATISATVSDGGDNVYVLGRFVGTVSFGATVLTSAGTGDVFIAKWNQSAAAFVWARRVGGVGDDYAYALSVSGTSVYVAGSFANSADFGPTTLTSAGADDGFVVKLSDTGTIGWAQAIGGPGNDWVTSLATAGANVYVGGILASRSAVLGTLAISNVSDTANGFTKDGFVARLTDAGATSAFAWAKVVGSTGDDMLTALAATGSTVYVAGNLGNTATFGSTTLSGCYYAKLPDTGVGTTFSWALSSGGAVYVNALAVSGANVYATGRFLFTSSWGSTTYANSGVGGSYDVFVAKFIDAGTSGSFTWALKGGGPASDYASGLAVQGNSVYVAGGYSSLFGPASFGTTSLTSVGDSDDWFVAKVLDAGASAAYAWVQQAGGSTYEQAAAVALGSGGRIYVSGSTGSGASFGSLTARTSSTLAWLADLLLASKSSVALAGFSNYPNPAHGTTTVHLPASTGPATLTLLDALGRVVRTQAAAPSTDCPLDLAGLAPGVYALRVQAGAALAVRQLVVE